MLIDAPPTIRRFQPLGVRVGDQELVPTGFELCEDLWCGDYRRNGQALNPSKVLELDEHSDLFF